MTWLNEEFPPCIAYGAQSAPMWMTTIAANRAGFEQRNQNWTQTRHEYDLSFAIRTQTDYLKVLKHWHMARGQLHSFGITDALDSVVDEGDGPVAAVSPGVFQLFKRYGTGADAYDRKITRPKPEGLVVFRDGLPATPGAGAGQYSLDLSKGRVTFVADQTKTVSTHTPGSQHVIDLASAFSPNVVPGDYIALADVVGTAAQVLNGRLHQVQSVVGDVITVDTDTTGLTASGGSAAIYAQTSELSWAGSFMVPVRYGMDRMPAVAINRSSPTELLVSVDGVMLIEVRE